MLAANVPVVYFRLMSINKVWFAFLFTAVIVLSLPARADFQELLPSDENLSGVSEPPPPRQFWVRYPKLPRYGFSYIAATGKENFERTQDTRAFFDRLSRVCHDHGFARFIYGYYSVKTVPQCRLGCNLATGGTNSSPASFKRYYEYRGVSPTYIESVLCASP